jgi:hypothetical protein
MKRSYKRLLVAHLSLEDDDSTLIALLKSTNLRKAMEMVKLAWDGAQPEALHKAWKKTGIHGQAAEEEEEDPEDDVPLAELRRACNALPGPTLNLAEVAQWVAADSTLSSVWAARAHRWQDHLRGSGGV